MEDLIKYVPLFPLIGVLVNGLAFTGLRRTYQRRFCGVIAAAMAGLAFVFAVLVATSLPGLLPRAYADVEVYRWLEFAGSSLSVPMAFRVDALSVTMTLVVTGVGTLIHVFSIGYMADDERFGRFFVYLNLFLFSMLLLVLANNYVLMFVGWEGVGLCSYLFIFWLLLMVLANNYGLMFVGWEGVGLCSYLLIGFWFEKVSASQAGKKAFIINRIGDFGFLLGMFALFAITGSLVFNSPDGTGALDQANKVNEALLWGLPAVTVICLFFFLACTGKSAQLPLYFWLPDAMEGPTPVSALIHAATMVTAGVYLVARSAPLFAQSAAAQTVVTVIGVVTALWAALIAIKQYDIKRVLAYSTVSQLGFMFVGVGTGAYAAGISHLVTHAFFKALMFLGAGAVMHSLEGQLDMRKMGNLKKHMPVTYLTFAVGWYCICGLPLGSGFFSKDSILEAAFHRGQENPVYMGVFALGVLVAALTGFYMTRMFVTVFHGSERIEMGDEGHGHDDGHGHPAHPTPGHTGHGHRGHGHAHVHPESAVMNWPLILLAIGSVLAAVVVFRLPGFIWGVTNGMVPHAEAGGEHGGGYPGMWLLPSAATLMSVPTVAGLVAALLGVGLAWRIGPEKFAQGWSKSADRGLSLHADAYEGVLHAVFVRGGSAFAQALYRFVDRLIIDGLVNGTAVVVDYLAESLRTLQTGYVRNYALVMLAGAVFVLGCFLFVVQDFLRNLKPQQMTTLIGVTIAVIVVLFIGTAFFDRREPASESDQPTS